MEFNGGMWIYLRKNHSWIDLGFCVFTCEWRKKNIILNKGDRRPLKCRAPNASNAIFWTHNNETVTETGIDDKGKSVYEIASASVDDRGSYQCKYKDKNDTLVVRREFRVNVRHEIKHISTPGFNKMECLLRGISKSEMEEHEKCIIAGHGEKVKLFCKAIDGYDRKPPTVRWYTDINGNNKEFTEMSVRNHTLEISRNCTSRTRFKCEVQNRLNTSPVARQFVVFTEISRKPYITINTYVKNKPAANQTFEMTSHCIGDPLTLSYKIDAFPPPTNVTFSFKSLKDTYITWTVINDSFTLESYDSCQSSSDDYDDDYDDDYSEGGKEPSVEECHSIEDYVVNEKQWKMINLYTLQVNITLKFTEDLLFTEYICNATNISGEDSWSHELERDDSLCARPH